MTDGKNGTPEISQREAQVARLQREWLMRQVVSYVNRLAGAQMAQGFLDPTGASAYAAKELAMVQAGLNEIMASIPPEEAEQQPENGETEKEAP